MKKIITSVLFVSLVQNYAFAQGCSDAGVCTIHSIKNNISSSGDSLRNEVLVGFGFGIGEQKTLVYTPYVEYTRYLSRQTSFSTKINFNAVTGELANTAGPGDLFLSLNHGFDMEKKWQKSFVIGLKVPFNNSDISKNGIHLPMPYQTSLGTTDLVLGLSYSRKAFGATFALQQPLSATNGNKFLPENYPSETLSSEYLPTNKFARQGDLLLRFSYNLPVNHKISIRPSLLSIYHLGNDHYRDADNIKTEIEKSYGLTVNGNVFVDYSINQTSGLELSLGTPFAIRTKRPDGLTRSFVASIDYKFRF